MSSLRIFRDGLKAARDFAMQIIARSFQIKRSRGDSIALSARLDLCSSLFKAPRYTIILGERANVQSRSVLNVYNGDIRLGAAAGIGIGTVVVGPVDVGTETAIAQHCFISGANHHYEDVGRPCRSQGMSVAKVTIGDGAWIGSNCVILPGVEIGSHTVIGAGSVVTRSIPAYCVAVGNPARIVKRYDPDQRAWVVEPRASQGRPSDSINSGEVPRVIPASD
jgi:acetyltransferase-like isoleucine patch superfamily enzyme